LNTSAFSTGQDVNRFEKILEQLPRINSQPLPSAVIRQQLSDFVVSEQLSFDLSGSGEHLFLLIEKQGCNTEWVARQLKQHFKLNNRAIGYAGRKDRHSVSRQWFSLHLPGKEVSLDGLDRFIDEFKVIDSQRHNKKLKQGAIQYNHFEIILRKVSDNIDELAIEAVRTNGFPNYFGYQRFGHQANNLVYADQLLSGSMEKKPSKNQRSMYLSAARSYLFNLIVAERIKQNLWHDLVIGDCLGFSDSRSFFVCETIDDNTLTRFESGDVSLSGWLAGKGTSEAQAEALVIETAVIQKYSTWLEGLIKENVLASRRLMRVIPKNLEVNNLAENSVMLKFSLPTGCFATALLRELVEVNDASVPT
jgi:tRNA pseudouridine13 synthase